MLGTAGGLRNKIVAIYLVLGAGNLAVWALSYAVFRHYPALIGTCLLAYSMGLRHAVDADHIIAIDNVTRKLMQDGQRPTGTGLYFSLGHSTIVFGLTAAAAFHATDIHRRLQALAELGDGAGILISASFLLFIAVLNMAVLASVVKAMRHQGAPGGAVTARTLPGRVLQRLSKLIRHSWQMYFVGLLFGLGFDTATEVSLMAISVAAAAQGLPLWSLLMFPALFTAGMTLVDATDNFLMLGAYRRVGTATAGAARYNLGVTLLSVLAALAVGGVEALRLLQDRMGLDGAFWQWLGAVNDCVAWFGYVLVGVFLLCWLYSVRHVRPFRARDGAFPSSGNGGGGASMPSYTETNNMYRRQCHE